MLALITLATCQAPAPEPTRDPPLDPELPESARRVEIRPEGNPGWEPWPRGGRDITCSQGTRVVEDANDLSELAATSHGVLLLAGSWSDLTRSSLAVLDAAAPSLRAAEVPVWCLEVHDPRLPGWPEKAAGFDLTDPEVEPMCSLYAKGTSSPLLLIRDGALVGCVQSPWALSPEELSRAVSTALQDGSHRTGDG